MNTTVKLGQGKRIDVFPNQDGTVTLYTGHHNEPMYLDPAQLGALIWALEAAGEALEVKRDRAAA